MLIYFESKNSCKRFLKKSYLCLVTWNEEKNCNMTLTENK